MRLKSVYIVETTPVQNDVIIKYLKILVAQKLWKYTLYSIKNKVNINYFLFVNIFNSRKVIFISSDMFFLLNLITDNIVFWNTKKEKLIILDTGHCYLKCISIWRVHAVKDDSFARH